MGLARTLAAVGLGAAIGIGSAGSAQATAAGALGLDIAIDGTYALNLAGNVLDVENFVSGPDFTWYDQSTVWWYSDVHFQTDISNLKIVPYAVAYGSSISPTSVESTIEPILWAEGYLPITETTGSPSLGVEGYGYAIYNESADGADPVYGDVGPNTLQDSKIFAFESVSGGIDYYGWLALYIEPNGPFAQGNLLYNQDPAGYAQASSPSYQVILDAYGYTNSGPIEAGFLPAGIPEPGDWVLLSLGAG